MMTMAKKSNAQRIAVIGHVTNAPNAIPLPEKKDRAAQLVKMNNFTRVLTEDGQLFDHIAYLKRQRGISDTEPFSVWEMDLCAGLLLASHLRRHDFEVKLINFIDSDNVDMKMAEIRSFEPDIIVLSTTFVLSQKHLCEIGQLIHKEIPDSFVVAGGHHVFTTLLYMDDNEREQYLLDTGLDAFLSDTQGEAGLLQLCKTFPQGLANVPNLVWRQEDGTVMHNQRVQEDNGINDTLIDFEDIGENAIVHIRTARSCSFKCAFCSYPTIAGDLAQMTLENAINTLRKARNLNVKALFFVDDTFNPL